jgi:hypothetical protein
MAAEGQLEPAANVKMLSTALLERKTSDLAADDKERADDAHMNNPSQLDDDPIDLFIQCDSLVEFHCSCNDLTGHPHA